MQTGSSVPRVRQVGLLGLLPQVPGSLVFGLLLSPIVASGAELASHNSN
jgi:hypothetical protein